MSAAVFAEARAFDDDALAALASPGLVRRAKKLLDVASIDGDAAADQVVVSVGDERVSFGAGRGLAQGQCSCATVGPCQHLLAAIVTLRDRSDSPIPDSPIPDSPVPDSLASDGDVVDSAASPGAGDSLVPWLLSIGDDELRRFASTPGLRWAVARVDSTADAHIVDGPTCTVEPIPGIEVRFMGRSLESAFCSPAGPHDRRNIALAVLAVRARHGAEMPAIAAAGRTGRSTQGPDRELAERVLGDVAGAVGDAVGSGIAHPTSLIQERFESLSVDARGAGLYRIGHLAAGVASQYEEAISLRAAADPGDLLRDLALTALVAERSAVELAGGEIPTWLRGTARADYAPLKPFDALGLGATAWVTRSGFGGMTGVLFDSTNRRFVEISASRRSGRVDVAAQYRSPIGWASGVNLATLSGQRVQISGALMSPHFRLSTTEKTSASTLGPWSRADLIAAEWDGTVPPRSSRLRGERTDRWAVLPVERAQPARYDQIDQKLVWPIGSRERDVEVTIGWAPHTEGAIETLERLSRRDVTHVVGRIVAGGSATSVLPVSVVVDGQLHVLADDPVADSSGRGRRGRNKAGRAHPPPVPASLAAVNSLGGRLLQLAERGVDSAGDDEIGSLSRFAGDVGLVSVASALAAPEFSVRTRVLRAAHLIEEHRHLASTPDD